MAVPKSLKNKRFKRVTQVHYDGCFIASIATITGKSYNEVFKIVHPKGTSGYHQVMMPVEKSIAMIHEGKFGFSVKQIKIPYRMSKLKKPTLLLIRWALDPSLMHAIVWDPKSGVIDPQYDPPLPMSEYQYQIDIALEIQAA